MAIEHFKTKAAEIARSFDFKSYSLRNISISNQDHSWRGGAAALMSSVDTDIPLSVAPGQTAVQITVSGSIVMQ